MDCRMEVEDGRYSKPNEEWIQNDPDPCYADTPVPPPWTKPRFICCIETSFLVSLDIYNMSSF